MKETLYNIKFNSHKNHNPHCDIVQGQIDKDTMICFVHQLTGEKSIVICEVYKGENYVVDSDVRSYSRAYNYEREIPKKYRDYWKVLKNLYHEKYSK